MGNNKKYKELAEFILQKVGGRENITFATHCMTRLRLTVKDKSIVSEKEIENLEGVIGTQWSNDQFQIIIGQSVGDLYSQFAGIADFAEEGSEQLNISANNKKFKITDIFSVISACIVPLIPILLGAGLIKAVGVVALSLGWLTAESPTYLMLNVAGDAGFYFLPIYSAYTAAKKFNTNPALAMLLGAMLLHPNFVSLISEGKELSWFGIPVYSASYGSMIFPSIMIVFVMGYVQRFFARKSPDAIRSIVEPFFTLLIMIPLAFAIIAPLGVMLSDYIALGLSWIYDTFGFIAVGILASIYPLLILTGMHTALGPIVINNYSVVGYDPFISASNYIANFCQSAASFAVGLKAKSKTTKPTAVSCGITAIAAGVTEPALFGISVRYKTPLIASMIGAFVGGCYIGITTVHKYVMGGSPGVFGLVTFIAENPMNLLNMLIGVAIAFIITFIFTLLLFKEAASKVSER